MEVSLQKQRYYLNSSGLIAMNNPIISPITTPMIVPAATPRASTFCSLLVIVNLTKTRGNPTTS